MIGIRLVFFLAFAALALFLLVRVPTRLRIIGISTSVVLLLVVGFFLFQGTRSDLAERVEQSRTPAPTVQLVATRLPPQPGFDSACRQFRLFVRDVDAGKLLDLEVRARRAEEIRKLVAFRGSPLEFRELIDIYSIAVDGRYGQDGAAEGASADDIVELDRAIRRARDEVISECRAQQN